MRKHRALDEHDGTRPASGRLRAPRKAPFASLAWAAAAGILYYLAARLTLPLLAPEGVAEFWPAAGVAAGALLIARHSALIPIAAAVAAASIAVNWPQSRSPAALLGFGLGNTGEALLVAALIWRWFAAPFELDRLRNVLGLFAASAIATALWEGLTAALLHFAEYSEVPFLLLWRRLVLANTSGIVMVAPVAIALAAALRRPPARGEWIEGAAVLVLYVFASLHSFALFPFPFANWMLVDPFASQLPLLLWLSVRCGSLFAAAGSLVLGLSTLGSLAMERGRFSDAAFPLTDRLLAVHIAMLATAFVALAISALIAERRNAEAAARRNAARLKLTLDAGNFGTWELDPGTGAFYACAQASRCFGLSSGSPAPFGAVLGALHPADRQFFAAQLRRVAEGGGDLDSECRALRADGGTRWLHIMGCAAETGEDGRPRIAGAVRDVTEQKSVAALRESAEQLRLFVEQAPVAIAMFDRDMRYLAVSSRWTAEHGIAQSDIIGRRLYDLFPDMPEAWKEVHRRAMTGEVVGGGEDPIERAGGQTQWLRWEARPWRATNGSIGGIVIFTEDVTTRVEAERALRESRKDLDRAQAVARTGSWRLNVKRNELTWSAETYRMFGIPAGTRLTYNDFIRAVHPEDREHVESSWKSALAGVPYDIEHRIVVDAETKWVRQRAELEFDRQGTVTGGFGTTQDITDKKLAEVQLQQQRRLTELIADRAADAIFLTDEKGCITYANPEAERTFGFEPPEMIGQDLHALLHHHRPDGSFFPRDACPMAKIHLAGAKVRNHEDVFFRKDALPVPVSCSCAPLELDGKCRGAVFVVRDIGAQKAAQAALRESEERLRLSTEAAGIATFSVDVKTGWASYSPELADILGAASIRGEKVEDAFARAHSDDAAWVRAKFEAGLAGAEDGRIRLEFRFLRPGGEVRWVIWNGRVYFRDGPSGREPFRIAGVCLDVTERRQAEQALRESEECFRAIVGTAVDAIIVIDETGAIQSINPAGERMFGYAAEEVIGKNVSMLMPEPQRSLHDSHIEAFCRTGEGKMAGGGGEAQHRRKDGSVFSSDLTVAEWRAGGKRYFTGIVRDVTERKRHDEKVQLLLREVNHRAKNMLALVQAIASRTAAPDHAEFMKRFSERLSALAASQDLLVGSGWRGVEIGALVRSQLSHFENLLDGRIGFSGPGLNLSAEAAQTIGMALHELATNAGKYGALSAGAGSIQIVWKLTRGEDGKERFELSWIEHGGPPAERPKRAGFGTTVIETIPRMELDAAIRLDYTPEGLRWYLNCPSGNVLEAASSDTGAAPQE